MQVYYLVHGTVAHYLPPPRPSTVNDTRTRTNPNLMCESYVAKVGNHYEPEAEFGCAFVRRSKLKEKSRGKCRTAPKKHNLPFQTEHVNWIGRKETRGNAMFRIKGKGRVSQRSQET
jgi:hypothetical protein